MSNVRHTLDFDEPRVVIRNSTASPRLVAFKQGENIIATRRWIGDALNSFWGHSSSMNDDAPSIIPIDRVSTMQVQKYSADE